jgi:hypothetical protein
MLRNNVRDDQIHAPMQATPTFVMMAALPV